MMGTIQKTNKEARLPGGGPNRQKTSNPSRARTMTRGSRGRRGRSHGGSHMYAEGGSVQPTYGSTVADAMPKAEAN